MNITRNSFLVIAVAGIVLVGCNKGEEPVATSPPNTTSSGVTAKPAGMVHDYSTPARINETVIPAVVAALAAEPMLSGKTFVVHLMDKVIHIKGDVDNNDQKRKIDEIVMPMQPEATSAGYNFLNGTIVKG